MAAINGSVKMAVHSVANPSEAPAMAYVAMPDGSSSEAPVIKPGPKTLINLRNLLSFCGFLERSAVMPSVACGRLTLRLSDGCLSLNWSSRRCLFTDHVQHPGQARPHFVCS